MVELLTASIESVFAKELILYTLGLGLEGRICRSEIPANSSVLRRDSAAPPETSERYSQFLLTAGRALHVLLFRYNNEAVVQNILCHMPGQLAQNKSSIYFN